MPKNRELTPYQILVLCGNRKEKHVSRLSRQIGRSENFVAQWATRGIPHKYWDLISEWSGCSIFEIADAQAYTLGTQNFDELRKYADTPEAKDQSAARMLARLTEGKTGVS